MNKCLNPQKLWQGNSNANPPTRKKRYRFSLCLEHVTDTKLTERVVSFSIFLKIWALHFWYFLIKNTTLIHINEASTISANVNLSVIFHEFLLFVIHYFLWFSVQKIEIKTKLAIKSLLFITVWLLYIILQNFK